VHCVHTAHNAAAQDHSQPQPTHPGRTPRAVGHGLILLMMGITMPETCWDRKFDNKHRVSCILLVLSLHLSIILIKGFALPSETFQSKTHAWYFLLAVYIGFEFILIQIRKRVTWLKQITQTSEAINWKENTNTKSSRLRSERLRGLAYR